MMLKFAVTEKTSAFVLSAFFLNHECPLHMAVTLFLAAMLGKAHRGRYRHHLEMLSMQTGKNKIFGDKSRFRQNF